MKRIIDGLLYDTEKAEKITTFSLLNIKYACLNIIASISKCTFLT